MRTILSFLLSACCFCSEAAVSFDASDDVLGTAINVHSNAPISVSAWIKVEGFSEGAEGSRIGIICERRATGKGWSFNCGSQNTVYGTNTLTFFCSHTTTALERTTGNQTVPSNWWTHVAVTWTGGTSTNDVSIYVSGQVVNSAVRLVNASGTYAPDPNLSFSIGARHDTSLTFGGQISDVAVWTNTLSAAEIAILANPRMARVPLQVRPKSLVAYWPMDGGPDGLAVSPADCVTDLSGRGNHASPTNSPAWKASPLSYP